eukprot:g7644.t1
MSATNTEDASCGYQRHFQNAVRSITRKQGFETFLKNSKFSDITLVNVDRVRISAHRLVLSAGSTRFNEILSQQEDGIGGDEILCTDLEASCLESMLEYLYTGNCNIQLHNAVKLLVAAMVYGCDELENMTNLFIHIHLNSSTCCLFFTEAQKHKLDQLSRKCALVASLDFSSVVRTPSFCTLSIEDLMALLGDEKIATLPKLLLYKAGCAWIMQDVTRLAKFKDVLLSIQMGSHSPDELKNALNGVQGTELLQLGYPEGFALDSSLMNNSQDPNQVNGIQSTLVSHKQTALQMAENRLKNVASVNSNGASDVTADTHLDTTDPCPTVIELNLAVHGEGTSSLPVQKMNKSTNSKSANSESLVNSDSMDFEMIQSAPNQSPSSLLSKTKIITRGRFGKGKKTHPHTCQVEGCTHDLRGLKEYHNRYRICVEHMKMDFIIKDEVPQRFCQQCGRFHPLTEFDNKKRSCRARLIRHNERRRRRLTKNSKTTQKAQSFIPFSAAGIAQQHLLYLSQMNGVKSSGGGGVRERNKIRNDNSVAATAAAAHCVQFLPTDLDRCFMLSTVKSVDQQNNHHPQGARLEKSQRGNASHNQTSGDQPVSTNNTAEMKP